MHSSSPKESSPLAVIFDMDGILIDSVELNWKAINQALAPSGVKVNGTDISQYLGKTLENQLERINDVFHIKLDYAEFASDVSQIKSSLLEDLSPKPGVSELLKGLTKAHIPFTVATSTSRAIAKQYLDITGLLAYFDTDTIVAAEDVVKHKPDPEVYVKAAKALGVNPAKCVVVEDAPAGVQAAKVAGMSCIALSTTYVSGKDLRIADLIIPSMEAINLSIIQSVVDNS